MTHDHDPLDPDNDTGTLLPDRPGDPTVIVTPAARPRRQWLEVVVVLALVLLAAAVVFLTLTVRSAQAGEDAARAEATKAREAAEAAFGQSEFNADLLQRLDSDDAEQRALAAQAVSDLIRQLRTDQAAVDERVTAQLQAILDAVLAELQQPANRERDPSQAPDGASPQPARTSLPTARPSPSPGRSPCPLLTNPITGSCIP
jgi:pyruvate/2-oxoglutarate dehydrogenase complex dihydrolipoamide acyltransferase (E2) component